MVYRAYDLVAKVLRFLNVDLVTIAERVPLFPASPDVVDKSPDAIPDVQ